LLCHFISSEFLIPQSGFFSTRFGGLTMRTYYQSKDSGNSHVTFCNRFGPEMRTTYNSTNPYPLYPLCNCSILEANSEHFVCEPRYKKKLIEELLKYYERISMSRIDFPYMYPEDNSLNNKYRSLYFQNYNASRNISERLFV